MKASTLPARPRLLEGRLVIKRAPALAALVVAALALVSTASPGPAARTSVVSIYAPRGVSNNCARVLLLRRAVEGPALLKGAMQALLIGPSKAERARGYGGWFSAKTAGHLRDVRIVHGVAFIDFRNFARDIPNASTSCGSALLLAQLDRTARQFSTVKRTVYSFDGSRHAFYEWLQREPPQVWG